MHFADQSGVLALIIFLLCCGESGNPHLLGILPDFKHWCLSGVSQHLLCKWDKSGFFQYAEFLLFTGLFFINFYILFIHYVGKSTLPNIIHLKKNL